MTKRCHLQWTPKVCEQIGRLVENYEGTKGEAFCMIARNSMSLFGVSVSADAVQKGYYAKVHTSTPRTSVNTPSESESVTLMKLKMAQELLDFIRSA